MKYSGLIILSVMLDYFKTTEERNKWYSILKSYLDNGEFKKPGKLFNEEDIRRILSSMNLDS